MSIDRRDKLVRMANQIVAALASQHGEAQSAEATAAHLRRFWTPRMIEDLLAKAAEAESGLQGPARRAAELLRD